MLRVFKNGLTYLGYIFNPPVCTACHCPLRERTVFCSWCNTRVGEIVSCTLALTKKYDLTVYAAAAYQEPVRSLILQKSSGVVAGSYALAQLIIERTPFCRMPCDYLVPVPLYWVRQWRRGFNQTYEMAVCLAAQRACSVVPLVRRVRHTNYQSHVDIALRQTNVKDAFALARFIDSDAISGKHVVLIDDLMTTGSTLVQTARVLLPLKPASISAVVACRAMPVAR